MPAGGAGTPCRVAALPNLAKPDAAAVAVVGRGSAADGRCMGHGGRRETTKKAVSPGAWWSKYLGVCRSEGASLRRRFAGRAASGASVSLLGRSQ